MVTIIVWISLWEIFITQDIDEINVHVKLLKVRVQVKEVGMAWESRRRQQLKAKASLWVAGRKQVGMPILQRLLFPLETGGHTNR